jgi:flagellar FliJ protein
MAKFNYRMQNILNVKYKLETQAKTAYGVAANRLAEEEEKLQALQERRSAYEQYARQLVSDKLDMMEIKHCRSAIDALKVAIENQILQVHIAQRNLENARLRLNEVMIDRKTHEKLKEKAFEEFKHEIEAEESKAVDELVSYTYQGAKKS